MVAIVATAVVGVLVATWVLFSATTGARIIVFATGSMSPTLPQGAAAVSMPVSADALQVGDVVTVKREGAQRPVTHRVVEIRAVPQDPASRELVLQGDANKTPDIDTYVVDRAHRVVWGARQFGTVARALQDPRARVVMWIGAAGAVMWALWPQERGRRRA